jgi:hypothetical protein
MHPTSKIARTSSVIFTESTLPVRGPQKGWEAGYSVGRKIEMRTIILMITSLADYI